MKVKRTHGSSKQDERDVQPCSVSRSLALGKAARGFTCRKPTKQPKVGNCALLMWQNYCCASCFVHFLAECRQPMHRLVPDFLLRSEVKIFFPFLMETVSSEQVDNAFVVEVSPGCVFVNVTDFRLHAVQGSTLDY